MAEITAETLAKIDVQCGVVKGPDGKHAGVLTFSTFHNQYNIVLQPNMIEALVEHLPKQLGQVLADIAIADSGIILPNSLSQNGAQK